MSELFLENLNPEQREAVAHVSGPLLILAGAGSGKTTVLVNRTGRLIASGEAPSDRICVLTFTNKAASELKQRVSHRLGPRAKGLWAGTFHSFGLQILRKNHKKAGLPQKFGILDAGDARAVVKDLLKDFNLSGKTDFDPEKLLALMSAWRERNQKRATTEYDYDVCAEWLLPKYARKLNLLGVVDFDDLILRPLELIRDHPELSAQFQFDQVMVDEFQDTNASQMRLIQALVCSHQNIVVVGDDDQAIYGWRGANVAHILEFPHAYPGCRVIRLERNYRSTSAILEVANSVIQNNSTRHGKILRSQKQLPDQVRPESFVFETEEEEADGLAQDILQLHRQGHAFKEIAVLYRSNSQGALLEASLRFNQIPYNLSGGTAFFDRTETKDLLAYLRCSLRPHEVAYRRIINTPLRGIGEASLDKIAKHSHDNDLSFYQAAQDWRAIGVQPAIGARIDEFHHVLEHLIDDILKVKLGQTAGDRLLEIITEMGYREYVYKQHRDPKVGAKRWTLVEIFTRVFTSFAMQGGLSAKTIQEFVDAMELRDAMVKSNPDEDTSEVQLLTLHACKGLEFPIVYMIGLEEDLIPHKTLGSDISEERRLFYVGVTRAQQRLILTRARQRRRYGRLAPSSPSRFLLEIPTPLIQQFDGARPCAAPDRQSLLADLYRKLDQNASQSETGKKI